MTDELAREIDRATCKLCAEGNLVDVRGFHWFKAFTGQECTGCDSKREALLPIIERAVLAEREACAVIADNYSNDLRWGMNTAGHVAAQIRARGAKAAEKRGESGLAESGKWAITEDI